MTINLYTLIFYLLLILFPIFSEAQTFEVTAATSLRTEASSKSKVLRRVQAGDSGDVISKEQWWTKVDFNGQVGFIKTANLTFENVKKPSPPSLEQPIKSEKTTPAPIVNDPINNNKSADKKTEADKMTSAGVSQPHVQYSHPFQCDSKWAPAAAPLYY